MNCPACGTANSDVAGFCGTCGGPLRSAGTQPTPGLGAPPGGPPLGATPPPGWPASHSGPVYPPPPDYSSAPAGTPGYPPGPSGYSPAGYPGGAPGAPPGYGSAPPGTPPGYGPPGAYPPQQPYPPPYPQVPPGYPPPGTPGYPPQSYPGAGPAGWGQQQGWGGQPGVATGQVDWKAALMGAGAAVVLIVIGWATIVPAIFRGTSGIGSWYFFCICVFATAGGVCMQQSPARNLRDAAVAGALGQVGGIVYGMMQGVRLSGEALMWVGIAAALGYAGGYMVLNYSQKKGL